MIYNGQEAGVFYFDGGMGTLEDNDVWGNCDAGVQIIEASDPLVTRNRLLKQHKQMQKMMKKMKGGGMANMMRGLGGASGGLPGMGGMPGLPPKFK